MSRSYRELFKLYEDIFKPAYADLIPCIEKTIDILVKMENTLAYILFLLMIHNPIM
ncbi:hypothetical protein [Desulfurobacterium sp.]